MTFDEPLTCDQGQPWCRLIASMLRCGAVEIRSIEGEYLVSWSGELGDGATIFEAIEAVYRKVYRTKEVAT